MVRLTRAELLSELPLQKRTIPLLALWVRHLTPCSCKFSKVILLVLTFYKEHVISNCTQLLRQVNFLFFLQKTKNRMQNVFYKNPKGAQSFRGRTDSWIHLFQTSDNVKHLQRYMLPEVHGLKSNLFLWVINTVGKVSAGVNSSVTLTCWTR